MREAFFGDKPASISGGSGGGIMAYQYLAKYGEHVKEAFIYTATADLNSMGTHDRSNLLRVMADFGVKQSLAEEVFGKDPDRPRLLRIVDQENQAAFTEQYRDYQNCLNNLTAGTGLCLMSCCQNTATGTSSAK